MNLKELSNKELYKLCKEYGTATRKWRRKFAFLLPEVSRRGMYRKYGCESIYQFAAKLGGMSHDVVQRILSLSHKLKDKPLLWAEFERHGWAKLSVIASIATKESEKFCLDKLNRLPKAALAEYVSNYKRNCAKENEQSLFCDLPMPKSAGALDFGAAIFEKTMDDQAKDATTPGWPDDDDVIFASNYQKLKFKVSTKAQIKFRKIKRELERERGEALTMGEVLEYLIALALGTPTPTPTPTRHISAVLKRAVISKTNAECAILGCHRPYDELHHPQRFALNKSHEGLMPICKIHHQLAHGLGDSYIDKKVRKYWQLE